MPGKGGRFSVYRNQRELEENIERQLQELSAEGVAARLPVRCSEAWGSGCCTSRLGRCWPCRREMGTTRTERLDSSARTRAE